MTSGPFGINAKSHVYVGDMVDEVEKAAQECLATMIIIPTFGKSSWKERFIGNTLETLAERSVFPVLIIPDSFENNHSILKVRQDVPLTKGGFNGRNNYIRKFGAGSEILGQMLAKELGYTFVDNEIIRMIAKEANVSPNFVKLVEDQGGSKIIKVYFNPGLKSKIERILAEDSGYIDDEKYIDYLVLIIAQIAEEGNAVILGRGSLVYIERST